MAAERDEELEGVEDDGPLGDGGEAELAGLQQPRAASVGALPSASAPRVLGTATTTGLGVFGQSGMPMHVPPLNNPFPMNTAGAQMGNTGAPMGLAGAMGMPAPVSYHQMAGQLTSPSPPAVRRRAGRSPGGNSNGTSDTGGFGTAMEAHFHAVESTLGALVADINTRLAPWIGRV